MNQEKIENIISTVDETVKRYNNYPIDDVVYFDLNPVYKLSSLYKDLISVVINLLNSKRIGIEPVMANVDYIACVESRGFLLGAVIADRFNKGLVLLRSKESRLPGKTSKVKHKLEYGTATMEVQKGKGNVLIFDDVIATGGTASAAVKVLKKAGYNPISALFILELAYCNPKFKLDYQSVKVYNSDQE